MSTQEVAPQVEHLTSEEEIQKLNKESSSGAQKVGKILAYLGMAFILIYCIFPFYFMVVAALYPDSVGGIKNSLNPFPATLENLASVFDPKNGFVRALLNSLIVSTVTTVLTLVFGILGSYALARLRFRVTVSCDNRLMSGTTLSREFALLSEAFGYGLDDLRWFTVNAAKSAFHPFDERLALIENVIKPGFAAAAG